MNYPVNDIYLSIQGEGVKAGTPMVILRLQGCEVGCAFCDTKYTWKLAKEDRIYPLTSSFPKDTPSPIWTEFESEKISSFIAKKFPEIEWVLITGGEPARYKLKDLVGNLHTAGKKVAIETSGMEIGHIRSDADWVTISPKIHSKEQLNKIDYRSFDFVNEIKMVVGKKDHIRLFDDFMRYIYFREGAEVVISLQPMSLSKKATQLCLDTCLERGWNISLQLHQFLKIP